MYHTLYLALHINGLCSLSRVVTLCGIYVLISSDFYVCFFPPSDLTFVTGSHIGELIVWDALDWTKQASECNFWDSSVHPDLQPEIKLSQSPHETSIQHLTSDEEVKSFRVNYFK